LTGGGDCPGLNAVIRAAVKTAILEYNWEPIGIPDGFEGLVSADRSLPLGLGDVRGLLPRGGTVLGTTNRFNPFEVPVVGDGRYRSVDRSPHLLSRLRELGLDFLLVIGGDGTLSIARRLAGMGVAIMGVPKTIDNDVAATDVTFGFDTALHVATDAIDRLHTTAESHGRVMVLELMGRDAGWIALHAGIAGGADVILIPEIPFTLEGVRRAIAHRDARGHHFSIVVVAEGARRPGGTPERRRHEGIGTWLASQLQQDGRHEVRCTVLGHIQRGGSPSPFDRVLATRFGAAAVRLAAEEGFGRVVALRGDVIVSATLDEACGSPKRVPPDGELVRTARGMAISFGE
jgi:6-phosphofructokinase 1